MFMYLPSGERIRGGFPKFLKLLRIKGGLPKFLGPKLAQKGEVMANFFFKTRFRILGILDCSLINGGF